LKGNNFLLMCVSRLQVLTKQQPIAAVSVIHSHAARNKKSPLSPLRLPAASNSCCLPPPPYKPSPFYAARCPS
jgi:hypothetical protein